MRRAMVWVWAVGMLLPATPSFAAAPGAGATFENNPINYEPPAPQRRGGIAVGTSFGYGIGSYSGYPLEVAAIDDPEQRASTGPALASNISLWVGGALRDWLTPGVGVSLMGASGEMQAGALGLLFHVETFPLFSMGGLYQDLGLAFDGGLSLSTILDRNSDDPDAILAESGAMSTIGLSVFWEPLRFSHFSAGPVVSYVHAFSQTMQVNQGTLGFRLALYGVAPKRKRKNIHETQAAHRSSAPRF